MDPNAYMCLNPLFSGRFLPDLNLIEGIRKASGINWLFNA
jgi:hypothetical protein